MAEQWDKNRISQKFHAEAMARTRYMEDITPNARGGDTASQLNYDMDAAAFTVYESLWGKTFLSSREELVRHLEKMLNVPGSDAGVFDPGAFQQRRRAVIKNLIAEYSR